MSFCLSFHQALLGPTGAHWLDDPPDLSCKERTGRHAVDGWPLSCKQELEVFYPDDCPCGPIRRSWPTTPPRPASGPLPATLTRLSPAAWAGRPPRTRPRRGR
jgi:hypothetical protein